MLSYMSLLFYINGCLGGDVVYTALMLYYHLRAVLCHFTHKNSITSISPNLIFMLLFHTFNLHTVRNPKTHGDNFCSNSQLSPRDGNSKKITFVCTRVVCFSGALPSLCGPLFQSLSFSYFLRGLSRTFPADERFSWILYV